MSLAVRQLEPEWMDDPEIEPSLLHGAFDGLRRVNQWCSSRHTLVRHLTSWARTNDGRLSVIDLGCGTGDVAMWITEQCRKRGVDVIVNGCDLSPLAIQRAASTAAQRKSPSTFFEADLLNDPFPEGYDVAISSLFLHHLPDDAVASLLSELREHLRIGFAIDDLRRTRLGLMFAHVGGRLLSRSPVVHEDGPQSVRAAFTIDELADLSAEAGLRDVTFERQWPQRVVMVWRR